MSEQGKAIWNELGTTDVDAAKTFYGKVLGWSFEEMDVGTGPYTIAKHGEGPAGGIMNMQGSEFEPAPKQWYVYFAVDDVDAACQSVSASGGQVHQQPFDIPTVGRIAICADPSGAMFGLMTPLEQTDQ